MVGHSNSDSHVISILSPRVVTDRSEADMEKVAWQGGALIAPVPAVMVSCGDMECSNIITVAWCGITNTIPPKTYISVRPSRQSVGIIKEKGEFVINLVPATLARKADWCGIYTGKKVDKFQKCGKAPMGRILSVTNASGRSMGYHNIHAAVPNNLEE